jgi:hypothetical protein
VSSFTVQLNTRDVDRAVDLLKERAPYAIVRALNRAAASATVAMIRVISQDTGIKQSDLKGTTRRNRAIWSSQAAPGREAVTVFANTTRIPLYDFQARQTKRGVTARLGLRRRTYPSTFIAKMPSGHPGAWKRTGKKRLPIVELHGPSIAHVWDKHAAVGQARAGEQLMKNLNSEFRFAMRRS